MGRLTPAPEARVTTRILLLHLAVELALAVLFLWKALTILAMRPVAEIPQLKISPTCRPC